MRVKHFEPTDLMAAKPIYMHLRRLAEFQIAIAQLDRLTHPRRFRRYKKRSLEIVYIDDFNSEPILTSLPTKVGDWENVMAKALGHAHVELIEEHKPLLLPIYNDLVVAASSRDDHYGTSIHPPSQLLLFLATSPVYPPPLPQIGCSRSPCAACAAVFSAWWALNDAPSFTCRSSDGWYPLSWSVPTEWKELRVQHEVAILEVVYDKVAERFARSMLELGLVKVKGSRESEDWGQEKDTRAKEIEEDDQKQEPSGTDGQP